MTQKQKYKVTKSFPKFELRNYSNANTAEIEMSGGYSTATSSAFRHLFKYISGGNEKSQKIAMTAPVIATAHDSMNSDNWTIAFVMPDGEKFEELPNPTDINVVLREVESQDFVAISFRGRATSRKCEKKDHQLRDLAHAANFSLSTETKICRFDAPFKPGFMHYNEILVPILN